QKVTFSAWIKYENVVQGRNFWNVFNCFKHYLFRKNSETGVQSGPDYATLGMYKGSADWKYITFTYDYSEKTNFDQLKTSLRFNLEGATSGTAWVTGIKVEIGSVATDWSPAPEDADGLITEAKATFERTAQGLRTDLSAIQEYVNKDGQRQEALQRYTREESTRQATAVRELVNRDFVGKATYQEDVKGINQRIEAVKTSANKDIASQIASYRQSVDGKFTDISSQITTYKQDVGGQISGLSNRLTSSEQGTTTQISNLSNRINSNKQGTDNQISNLKTQVATNKANADSQFANVTNQLARKVETTDFQRVKETSKLYERILGNTENGIADKVARMALTNQLFQVEVAKNASNGQNLLKGTKDFSGGWKNKGANWKKHAEKYKGVDVLFKNNSWNGVGQEIDAKIGEVYTFSLWMKSDWKNDTVNFYVNRNGSVEKGWGVPSETSVAITSEWKRYSFTFKITVDGFIFPRVERLNQNTNLYIAGLKLEKGSYATPYTEAPEDTDEAIRSVQSQLTGSWAVQNINSAGDIISGINLGANGHNRFVGKLTHITGETLIDRAVIKSAMVDKLKTANFEAGSVTTTILDAEAVTAEKLKVDDALIRKLTAKDAFIDRLTSKRIFSTKVESVISSSTFLEAYQGRIGGFTLGQFDQGGGRWISGVNQFSVGMGNGAGYGVRTAFWANWGNNWNYAGPKAWNVNTDGKMYCRNEVGFYDQVDFSNSSRANFYGNTTFSRSPVFSNGIELGSKDVLGDGWNPKGVGKLTHITGETLIDRAVIKSAMVDKLKTANFEAGSVTTTILDAEAVTADKVRFDAAFIRKMTANDAFIDQLTSGRIFSTKVESVISSSTFLEAYQGRIGGFTLGQFDQGGGRWISGVNQFSVGMGNGAGYGVRTAFWANWGNNWNYAGPKAWNVNTDGKMYCRNEVGFYDQVDFSNSSRANFYGNTTFSRSPVFSNGIELGSKDVLGDGWNPKGGRNAVVWWNQVGSGSVKYWMEQKSDRRLKENITDTAVKALDKINRLRMVAFDFIENKKHEEIGLIAQEAETIVPKIVSRDPENPDGYLHIDYTALVPYLIKAIQELNQKIEKMEKTIA
uniref:tail fiber domain-containing protein n=1 Tax=Streptococcus pneumoniae TaxID=1313 RepID=UPI0029666779